MSHAVDAQKPRDPGQVPTILLFDAPDHTYIGLVDGQWWRWPAERHGWRKRVACSEHDSYGRPQFDERRALLGWRLSGVRVPDTRPE
jgi:hypothetical protein